MQMWLSLKVFLLIFFFHSHPIWFCDSFRGSFSISSAFCTDVRYRLRILLKWWFKSLYSLFCILKKQRCRNSIRRLQDGIPGETTFGWTCRRHWRLVRNTKNHNLRRGCLERKKQRWRSRWILMKPDIISGFCDCVHFRLHPPNGL